MFRLDLSDQEHEMLKGLLKERLGTLKSEIHRSEVSSFTDELREEKSSLCQLCDRLEAPSGKVFGRNGGQYYAGPVECATHFSSIL